MDEKQEKTTIQMADVDFKFRRCVLLLICIFLWLSILPYFPEDMDYFRGGLSGSLYPKNLLGATGSYIGWFMLISFGLGAYGIAAIVTLGSLRRLVWRGGLRKAGWEYKLSYVLVVLGMVIMLGLCPDHFQAVTGYLNIRTMPGGVLGDFLCAKGHGMLYLLLNSIGTFLIGLVLFFSGLWVLWTHDWNMFAKLLWTKLGNRTRSRKTTEGKSADSAPEEKIEEEENSAKEKLPIFDKEKGKEKFPIFKPRGRRNHPEPQLKTTKMPFFNVKGLKKTTPEFESEISAPTADALPSLKPE
ncbi:MAG: DNA translocase FtsK 4TM domain-containing protein, partial [Lentisphaeria bacterium]